MEKGVVDDGTRKSETRYELEHDRGVHHCQEGAGHLAQEGSVGSCHLAQSSQLRGQKVTGYDCSSDCDVKSICHHKFKSGSVSVLFIQTYKSCCLEHILILLV